MEFNPYQPPRSTLANEYRPVTGRLYIGSNYAYATLVLGSTVILLSSHPPPLDLLTLWAAIYFYAPLFCFALLRWGPPRHFSKVLAGYGFYVVVLVGIMLRNLASPSPDLAIGTVIVGLNLAWLAATYFRVRPDNPSKPNPDLGGA